MEWPAGRVIDHPAVLEEAANQDPGRRPVLRERNGLRIVTYGRSRVYVDRDAWEMLPPDGVLLMRVTPKSSDSFALAFTPEELSDVFGEVRETESWKMARCYHFPRDPPAISAFRVPTANAEPRTAYTSTHPSSSVASQERASAVPVVGGPGPSTHDEQLSRPRFVKGDLVGAERYEIRRLLRTTPSKDVYRAHSNSLDCDVAIDVLTKKSSCPTA